MKNTGLNDLCTKHSRGTGGKNRLNLLLEEGFFSFDKSHPLVSLFDFNFSFTNRVLLVKRARQGQHSPSLKVSWEAIKGESGIENQAIHQPSVVEVALGSLRHANIFMVNAIVGSDGLERFHDEPSEGSIARISRSTGHGGLGDGMQAIVVMNQRF